MALDVSVPSLPQSPLQRYRKLCRPEEEGTWALPHGEFGFDVIALIGQLRYGQHRSIPEIHQDLRGRGLEIAERTVTNLLARYIVHAREQLFWRYYASHALRLSLRLICKNVTRNRMAGLVIPLSEVVTLDDIHSIADLQMVGESLIGWLSRSGSSHTLLTSTPLFEYASDYRLYRLQAIEGGLPLEEDIPIDNTLLFIDRRANISTLTAGAVKAIRRLLTPLYENVQLSRACFGQGMRDALDPATDLDSNYPDYILDGLAELVVRLGIISGYQRWRFCCILLPDDISLPLQKRSLVVRAQSANGPHKVGETFISPNQTTISMSLRAYQSGQIIYRPEIYEADSALSSQGLLRIPPQHNLILLP